MPPPSIYATMESPRISYSHVESIARIDEILAAAEATFEELSNIPPRSRLTFTNGFYVNCSAVFIDLRGSSKLPTKYRRPTLAKIYRSYISECVAVFNGDDRCMEVNIQGDAVWAVFDTPQKNHINSVFETVGRLNSLVRMLNCRLKRNGMEPISAGIGVSYGSALMIKAGHKGSTVNDVVWMGEVVNHASNLCSKAARPQTPAILVADSFHQNLKPEYQKFLTRNPAESCYEGNVFNSAMEEWWADNCS